MNIINGENNIKEINHSVIKSPNDKNEYYYDMLSNGLKYIIMSNKEIDKSAVSLDVYIGSSDDPKEYQGLAHCLEHVIFLGTKKFPNASEFDNFLNYNNGYSNANTSLDHTNYHFCINNEQLEKGLEMFSEFFIEPLFKEEFINRELNAIESEFKLGYRNDNNRIQNLFLIEGYKNSNFNTFITGNLETLQKKEIRDKVIEFYNTKYDPKIMSLCLFSNKGIDELKNIVIKYFSRIKKNDNFYKSQKTILYDKNNMGYLYKIIPIKDISYIQFAWIINKSYNSYYKSEPYLYVVSVLGHESKYSLTSYLKKKHYINALFSSYAVTDDFFTKITLQIKLTDEGYNNINEIIQIILSYVNFLQKEEIHKDFFEETKKFCDINFFFVEKKEPIELCEGIANLLTFMKPNYEIFIKKKIEEYRPDLIKEILDSLTTENLNIYLLSFRFKDNNNEEQTKFNVEKIYGTEYIKEKMDFSSFNIDIKSINNLDLSYPEINPFLPNNLKMIDLNKENINMDDYLFPKKIYDNDKIIWYKPIIKYNIPKVFISCEAYISSLDIDDSTYIAYSDIFLSLIEKELSEFLYLGEISSNNISFNFSFSSVSIDIYGYTDSIENYIIEYFNKLSEIIDFQKIEEIFNKLNTILEIMIQKINNIYMGNTREQTELYLKRIIREINAMKKLECCIKFKNEIEKNIIPNEFLKFIKNIFKKVKYEYLIEGNIYYKDGERIILKLENELSKCFGGENQNKEKLTIGEIRKQRIINLPEDKIYRYNFSSKDKENESSTILIYFQIGDFYYNDKNIFDKKMYEEYIKHKALQFIIYNIFYEVFYDDLRTQQQIGYDVDIRIENENFIFGIYFFISSSQYNPDEMVEKINKFLVDRDINNENNFTDEDFELYKNSLLYELAQKPLTLDTEFKRDLSYISYRTYKFSSNQDMINYLNNNLTKQDVIDFFNEYIYKKAKRLEIALYSSKNIYINDISKNENKINNNTIANKILPSYENKKVEIIKDINEFHKIIKFYENEFY